MERLNKRVRDYYFGLLPEYSAEIRGRLKESLRRTLGVHGFRVEVPARLLGKSGAEHWADLSATAPDGGTILMDIYVSHDIIDEGPIISTYAKVLDTSPSRTFLFVMPKATDAANMLAESYKIRLVQGVSVEDLITNFEEEFAVKAA